ncbi:hypothetical protein AAC387_Pa05g2703 [Persea americana]
MADFHHPLFTKRSSATLSKKPTISTGRNGYGDVFGGPPKLSDPRIDDYAEIFGNFYSHRPPPSIPVLDFPGSGSEDFSVDTRSPNFDYSEVFGGFGSAGDFAVSFDEMFAAKKTSGEFRKPTEKDSHQKASPVVSKERDIDSLASSEKNSSPSNGPYHYDGAKQFNVSYNKTNQRGKDDSITGTTHIAQLHEVSGFTYVVDTCFTSQMTGSDKHPPQKSGDLGLDSNSNGVIKDENDYKADKKQLENNGSAAVSDHLQNFGHVMSSGDKSHAGKVFLTVSEINLRTQPSRVPPPSRPPPKLVVKKGDSKSTLGATMKAYPDEACRDNSRTKDRAYLLRAVSETNAREDTAMDSSFPCFDVEVDASSAAAASAAAMKEAMEKAEARIRSAKQLMERKRDNIQNRMKLGLNENRKGKERREAKIAQQNNKMEMNQEIFETENGEKDPFTGDQRHKNLRATNIGPDEGYIEIAKEAIEKWQRKECGATSESHKKEGAGAWKAEKQFYELVEDDTFKVAELPAKANDGKLNERNAFGETIWLDKKEKLRELKEAFEWEKNDRKLNVATKDVNEKKLETGKEQEEYAKKIDACEQEENEKKIKEAQEEKNEKKLKATQEARERDEIEKRLKVGPEALEWEVSEKKLKEECEAFEWEENEKRIKAAQEAHEQEENERRIKKAEQEAREREENEKIMKAAQAAREREENEKRRKAEREARERKENEKRIKAEQEAREREENEKKLKAAQEAREREENEKKLKAAQEAREENEKKLKAAQEAREENEKKLKAAQEAREREENEKKLKVAQEAREREENEKKLKVAQEAREREENEKKLKAAQEAREREENEQKLKAAQEAREREENEQKLKAAQEAREREENEKKLKAAQEAREREENEKKLKAAQEAREREENEKKLKAAAQEAQEREENEKKLKAAQEAHDQEENYKKRKEGYVYEHEDKKTTQATAEVQDSEYHKKLEAEEKSKKKLEAQQEDCALEENEKKVTAPQEAHEYEEKLKAIKEASKQEENVKTDMFELKENYKKLSGAQDSSTHEENKRKLTATQVESMQDETEEKQKTTQQASQQEEESVKKTKVAEEACLLDSINVKLRAAKEAIGCELNERNAKASQGNVKLRIAKDIIGCELNERNAKASQGSSESGKIKQKNERGGNEKNISEADVAVDGEESKNQSKTTQAVFQWLENVRKLKAAQRAFVLEEKENVAKTTPVVSLSQITEQKEKNANETCKIEEKERARMQREKELEMERARKLEEEREREREREKDRIAVERATSEARDRTSVEARERAERIAVERATAEARQRAMAEAREKAEKASAEARERSLAEKASMEARLRLERAAVERATAEARERAVERAMAERAASEARERAERSGTKADGGMRKSSSFSDVNDMARDSQIWAEGESAKRCKARLERHQRTVERAAKALAEKNRRDIVAQREQAERNRLAETLDADVRRWSNGKEGNLRALLSTLQYILGPESGWQPVPLTDVITSAAVKKAYRKATLCVHPDKVQQRGASIQQKYICEKVFDLLKEAWSRFNSEER